MELIFFIINLSFQAPGFIREYFLYCLIAFGIWIALNFRKKYKNADAFLKLKTGMLVLDGLFQAGKTRFMTLLAKESKDFGIFVLSNFYNGYNFIKWNSLKDLENLLNDLLILGEYQNFTDKDIKKIYQKEPLIYKEQMKTRKELRKKYKYIPTDGFFNRFLLLGDEFQNYFYNRNAMGNFTGDKEKFLKLLHQVRHFNALCVFGTQNASELDIKFRKLSSLYVNTFEKANGYLFGYNVYNFAVDRDFNLDIDKAVKYNKVPILKINYYELNNIIGKYVKFINRLNIFHDKINSLFKMNLFNERLINFRFHELDFYTKYNVNPNFDSYAKGDLFKKLNDFYKNKSENEKFNYKNYIN